MVVLFDLRWGLLLRGMWGGLTATPKNLETSYVLELYYTFGEVSCIVWLLWLALVWGGWVMSRNPEIF